MNEDELIRSWYSEEKVSQILVPNLATWRSRYDLKEQELLTESDTWVIRNMRKADITPQTTSDDIIHIVTAGEQYRPDVIAYNSYGDANLAWVILSANNKSSLFELLVGDEIVIPSIVSLYQSGGILTR